MSGDMYAGHLCATQLGGHIRIGAYSYLLNKISYDKDRDTVLLVLRSRTGETFSQVVGQRDVVHVEDPATEHMVAPLEVVSERIRPAVTVCADGRHEFDVLRGDDRCRCGRVQAVAR